MGYVRLKDMLEASHFGAENGPLHGYVAEATETMLNLLQRRMRLKHFYYRPFDLVLDENDPLYGEYGGNFTHEEEVAWVKATFERLLLSYGYSPSMALIEDGTTNADIIKFLQMELDGLWYKIENKGTRTIYEFFYKLQTWAFSLEPFFYVSGRYRIMYEPQKVIAALSAFLTENGDSTTKAFQGYDCYDAQEVLNLVQTWDSGGNFDDGGAGRFDWILDMRATTTLACLQRADRVHSRTINGTAVKALVWANQLQYIQQSLEYAKKATHITRCGLELNLTLSAFSGTTAQAISDIEASLGFAATGLSAEQIAGTQAVPLLGRAARIALGIGTKAVEGATSLQEMVYLGPLLTDDEIYSTRSEVAGDNTYGEFVQDWAPALVSNITEVVAVNGGESYTATLPYTPLKRKGVKVELQRTGDDAAVLMKDDGLGNMVPVYSVGVRPPYSGTVDYTTGVVTIYPYFDRNFTRLSMDFYSGGTVFPVVIPGTGTEVPDFVQALPADLLLAEEEVLPASVMLYLQLGDNSTQPLQYDHMDGDIIRFKPVVGVESVLDLAASGLDVSATPTLTLVFIDTDAATINEVQMSFSSRRTTIATLKSNHPCSYQTMRAGFDITEAAVLNAQNEVILYATFPPVKFYNTSNILKLNVCAYGGNV